MKKINYLIILLFPIYCNATQYTHVDYISGNSITAAGQNANENGIGTILNGNIDTGNISPTAGILGSQLSGSAGITGGQLANNTITSTQMGSSSINSTAIAPGSVTSTQVSTAAINGSTANSGGSQQQITQGTISTPDFRTNAVTISGTQSNIAGIGIQGTNINSVALTTIGGKVLLLANVVFHCTGSAGPLGDIDDGTTVFSVCNLVIGDGVVTNNYQCSLTALPSPSAAAHTYSLNWNNAANCSVQSYNLTAIELRD